jgi:hypothetical protein
MMNFIARRDRGEIVTDRWQNKFLEEGISL